MTPFSKWPLIKNSYQSRTDKKSPLFFKLCFVEKENWKVARKIFHHILLNIRAYLYNSGNYSFLVVHTFLWRPYSSYLFLNWCFLWINELKETFFLDLTKIWGVTKLLRILRIRKSSFCTNYTKNVKVPFVHSKNAKKNPWRILLVQKVTFAHTKRAKNSCVIIRMCKSSCGKY